MHLVEETRSGRSPTGMAVTPHHDVAEWWGGGPALACVCTCWRKRRRGWGRSLTAGMHFWLVLKGRNAMPDGPGLWFHYLIMFLVREPQHGRLCQSRPWRHLRWLHPPCLRRSRGLMSSTPGLSELHSTTILCPRNFGSCQIGNRARAADWPKNWIYGLSRSIMEIRNELGSFPRWVRRLMQLRKTLVRREQHSDQP